MSPFKTTVICCGNYQATDLFSVKTTGASGLIIFRPQVFLRSRLQASAVSAVIMFQITVMSPFNTLITFQATALSLVKSAGQLLELPFRALPFLQIRRLQASAQMTLKGTAIFC